MSAAGLAGRYRLVFVATQGDRRGRMVRGTLTLWARDSVTAVLHTFDGQPHPNLSEPYFGAARIELDSVGAYTEGRVDSDDPARPGVVVREGHWPRRDAPAEEELSLGLGAERNRRDVMIHDGAFVHAVIRERTADGFRGTWVASLGPTTYRSAGYFCADRAHDAQEGRN